MKNGLYASVLLVAIASSAFLFGDEPDAAKDARTVQTLLRLKGVDVNANPNLKAAVLRYLKTQQGQPKYLELIERFDIRDNNDELLKMVVADPSGDGGVHAARLLLKFADAERISTAFDAKNEDVAIATITALGLTGEKAAIELLTPLVTQTDRSNALRNAAASALGRNLNGQRFLLELAASGMLPKELQFTVANILFSSADETIREEAAKHLQLPADKGSKPLPPVAKLVAMQGDIEAGRKMFNTVGTCIKCHKVRGEGKEVGPDLSEIGSKLSHEAMFVSILDPSAGISHNYETYLIATDSGNIINGIMVSQTDDSVTIRDKEAITRTIPREEIDEIVKQKVSLMPADLQKDLTAEDLANIVGYLTTLKKQ